MVDMSLIPDLSGQAAKTGAARTALQTGQAAEGSDFLSRYRGAVLGQETVPAMYARIAKETGLDTAKAANQQVQGTLTQLPYTYSKATRGFDVNANQLQRIIGQKASELAPTAAATAASAASAQEAADRMMGYTQAQQAKELTPFSTEQTLLMDRQARETSGFPAQAEMEYNALVQKAQMGITLSEGEKNRAAQLEAAKMQRDAQMEQIKYQTEHANKYSATGTGGVFNTQTGQITTGAWS